MDTCEARAKVIDHAQELLDTLETYRDAYGRLHDFVSDCIEEGRLTEDMIPDDYRAIVDQLCACLDEEGKAKAVIAKAKEE